MSNFYQTRRHKQGLSGEKPSIISDKEGYDAQMSGYRQYLSNESLADSIADRMSNGGGSSHSSSDSYPTRSYEPPTLLGRIIIGAIGLFLFWLDYLIAIYIVTHSNPYPNNLEQPFTIAPLPYFLFLFIIVPGCVLFFPGYLLMAISFERPKKK
jgi:hypothetical protein